jgi:AcrR family transcriptional regulator
MTIDQQVSPVSRRERLRQLTIDEIKMIAREQIRDSGAHEVSLRAVARQMGMTAPALYRYFDSYEALMLALAEDAGEDLKAFMLAALEQVSVEAHSMRFTTAAHAYYDWAKTYPQQYKLIKGGFLVDSNRLLPSEVIVWDTLDIFIDIFQAAHQQGTLSLPPVTKCDLPHYTHLSHNLAEQGRSVPVPLLHFALTAWIMCHSFVVLALQEAFTQLADEAFALELKAFAKRLGL